MAAFVNMTRFAMNETLTRLTLIDAVSEGNEVTVGDVIMQTPDALAFAHSIIKAHAEVSAKAIEAEQMAHEAKPNGEADPAPSIN